MENVIKRLLRLNLEIEGSLRSLLVRPCDDILDILCEKVEDFNTLLSTINTNKSVDKPTAAEEVLPVSEPVSVPTAAEEELPVSEPASVTTAAEEELPASEPASVPTAAEEELPVSEPASVPTAAEEELPASEPASVPTATEEELPASEPAPEPTVAEEELPASEPAPESVFETPLPAEPEQPLPDESTPTLDPAIEASALAEAVSMYGPLTVTSIQDAVSESDEMLAEVEKTLNVEEPIEMGVPQKEDAPDIVDNVKDQDDAGNIETGIEPTETDNQSITSETSVPADTTNRQPDTEPTAVEPDNAAQDNTPRPTIADVVSNNEYRVEDMIARKKVVDLAKTFTINDKYRFVRGLFCEDRNDFEYTIAKISSFDSLGEVYNYLLNEQGWDIDNTEVKDFIKIVTKYFNTVNADY